VWDGVGESVECHIRRRRQLQFMPCDIMNGHGVVIGSSALPFAFREKPKFPRPLFQFRGICQNFKRVFILIRASNSGLPEDDGFGGELAFPFRFHGGINKNGDAIRR